MALVSDFEARASRKNAFETTSGPLDGPEGARQQTNAHNETRLRIDKSGGIRTPGRLPSEVLTHRFC